MGVILIVIGIMHSITTTLAAVDPKCDYYQDLSVGQRYNIYNNEYPSKYAAGTLCRWVGQTSPNAVIVLTCEDINLPPSRDCQQDKLIISKSGDSNFRDAHYYCGNGTLSTVSERNRISIGLTAAWYSMGGRFLCTITAIQYSTPTGTIESRAKCDCGLRQRRRIVGGVPTGVNEFPLMAGLVQSQKREMSLCGASIIATRYAISAAYCAYNQNPRRFGLLVGDHDINIRDDTASAALYIIENIIRHPQYNLGSKENDISIIKTEKTIRFGGDVGPVCLPFRFLNFDFNGQMVLALGWGRTEFAGPRPQELQKVNLTIVSNNKCQELLGAKIFSSVLCSYGDGKDACQYDSGGPLLWYDNETRRLQLIGIISYGIGCGGDLPTVNTRVTSYLAWIIQNTPDADYCK